jgi:hypothetical protein
VNSGFSAFGQHNAFTDFMDERLLTVERAGGSFVGWDPDAEDGWHAWHEDGVATGTEAVLSIGTLFIPVAGEVSAGAPHGVGLSESRPDGEVCGGRFRGRGPGRFVGSQGWGARCGGLGGRAAVR